MTKKIICRSCKSPKNQMIFGKKVYGGTKSQHFYKCAKCQIVYLHPINSKANEKNFYKNNFENFMNERSKNEIKWDDPYKHSISNKKEFLRRKKFLNFNSLKNKKILEIGSSSGFMLTPLNKNKNNLYGIEPSLEFRNYTIKKGIKTFENFNDLPKKHNNSFDLIMHYYVLEHIDNPMKFLKDSMKLLKRNGKIIFEVPNINDPLITFLKTKQFDNFYWSVVHHWYFSALTLGNLLKKNKFNFSFYFDQRYDISNHFTWLKDGLPGGTNKFKDIFSTQLNNLYKKNLISSSFCDTLGVIITK
ncbi:class I SAM-dependent methyltransferase [Alphaproteobacteria bacterium]|jgi:2-polyprenyl-3-methyl-5-hydroxy-6-metoxy-1,4-benzoquinol methylase|nr:class I SAM-dependent methyltransferase [Alphaproteobacteria bacterium]